MSISYGDRHGGKKWTFTKQIWWKTIDCHEMDMVESIGTALLFFIANLMLVQLVVETQGASISASSSAGWSLFLLCLGTILRYAARRFFRWFFEKIEFLNNPTATPKDKGEAS